MSPHITCLGDADPHKVTLSSESIPMPLLSTLADTLGRNLLELESELPGNSSPHLWSAQPYAGLDDPEHIPSQKAFDLINRIRVDLKAVEALITPNQLKLIELANLQSKVAALNTAVLLNLAGALDQLGGQASLGVIATQVNANEHKLGIDILKFQGKGAELMLRKDSASSDCRIHFSGGISRCLQAFKA
ncbi:hypothetical protein LTR10_019468 [Elasticomyces elasticus]|nr:hypothetical protein LTR10_019468 [Elasticomyces elasticus]KAK5039121.1 hypothetical protein LTR13_003376 [Exophiala sideris]